MLKLALRPGSRPDAAALAALWDFVRNRTPLSEFEQYIYANDGALQSIFTADTVFELMALDFNNVLEHGLRSDIRAAIEALPTPCECPKLAPGEEVDIGTLSHLDDSKAVLDYVADLLEKMALIRVDEGVIGYWQSVKNGVRGVKEFFQEARLYRCPTCQRAWLAVLNESNVSWCMVEVDHVTAKSGSTQALRDRLREAFGVEYAPGPA